MKYQILNIQNKKGSFDWIFVHHADNILELLLANYNTIEQACALFELGDLSRIEQSKVIAYRRDLKYPEASCFHLAEPKMKRGMSYEFDFKTKASFRDRDVSYFVFNNGWTEVVWQPHEWSKSIMP